MNQNYMHIVPGPDVLWQHISQYTLRVLQMHTWILIWKYISKEYENKMEYNIITSSIIGRQTILVVNYFFVTTKFFILQEYE